MTRRASGSGRNDPGWNKLGVPPEGGLELNRATLPFVLALAQHGEQALVRDVHLRRGLNIHRGRVTCAPVAHALGLPMISAEMARRMWRASAR